MFNKIKAFMALAWFAMPNNVCAEKLLPKKVAVKNKTSQFKALLAEVKSFLKEEVEKLTKQRDDKNTEDKVKISIDAKIKWTNATLKSIDYVDSKIGKKTPKEDMPALVNSAIDLAKSVKANYQKDFKQLLRALRECGGIDLNYSDFFYVKSLIATFVAWLGVAFIWKVNSNISRSVFAGITAGFTNFARIKHEEYKAIQKDFKELRKLFDTIKKMEKYNMPTISMQAGDLK